MSLAEDFARVFAGYEHAHGRYVVAAGTRANERGKVNGQANTRARAATLADWEGHLTGGDAIGIVPIRADATCVFGAIDVDVYPLEHLDLARAVADANLPLVVCRTKSGGAHLYLFTKEPVPASLMRKKLREWARYLGYEFITDPKTGKKRSTEIFPKQDTIENDEDRGSWINIPYYGGARSLRYAAAKRVLTPEEFIQCADSRAVPTAAALAALEPRTVGVGPTARAAAAPAGPLPDNIFRGAPPCLIALARLGFDAGSRNNGFFNLAVFAKKSYPEGWQDLARQLNQAHMRPPLPEEEVSSTLKSVERKRYSYKCKDQPIVDHCDRPTCLTCEFGVGGGVMVDEVGLDFGEMTKVLTKPVIWLWTISDELIELETEELMNQRRFQAKILETLNFWPPMVKPAEWRKLIQATTQTATRLEVPDEAKLAGQVIEQLGNFCTSRVAGRSLDELLMHKPFTDDGRSYFVVADFIAYLVQHRFSTRIDERQAYLLLRDHDLQHHRSTLKGKEIGYWSVRAFQAQTEEHAVPRRAPEEAM